MAPGNMFALDGTRRADGIDMIQMCSDDRHTVLIIRTGDTFMLVEADLPYTGPRTWQIPGPRTWRILFGGHIGTIQVSYRDRRSLRLVAQA